MGLRATQLGILSLVNRLGPITVGQLAEVTVTDRTTLTRGLKPLEREGFIKVLNGSADRREREVVMTQKGKTVLETAMPLWDKTQKKVVEKLGKDRSERLLKELSCCLSDLEKE